MEDPYLDYVCSDISTHLLLSKIIEKISGYIQCLYLLEGKQIDG